MRYLLFMAVILMTGFSSDKGREESLNYLSPTYMVYNPANELLYISLSTAQKVLIFDTESNSTVDHIHLEQNPAGMALSLDGNTLYIAGSSDQGRIFVVDLGTKKIKNSIAVGHTPQAVALSSDGNMLFVGNRFSNNVSVIDTRKMTEIKRIEVAREPAAIAISKDDNIVFVANYLPLDFSRENYASATVSVINTASLEVSGEIELPNGSNALNDMAVSPDGNYIYITHLLARYQLPTTQLDRGWINSNVISLIDVRNIRYYNTVLLDDVENGAANPWGITVSPDGRKLLVALSGTDELCVIDRVGLQQKLENRANELNPGELNNNIGISEDLRFSSELKTRIKLNGKGFRHVLATSENVFLTSTFSGTISSIDHTFKNDNSLKLPGGQSDISLEREGEILFHDATLAFQGWQSCSSCHPGNARVDGLNWDLLNDGIGSPRNTKSLLLAHQTPPAMITGVRADAETAVRAGIKYILFAVRPEHEAQALDAYLESLSPVPSPYLKNGKLSRNAKKGKRIFDEAECAHCHSGPYHTDMKLYNVDTSSGENETLFDTPTLVEVWRTAPYLNDGRAATIKEIFTEHNKNDKHGITSDLSEEEIDLMVEYINSL